jgi:hypothetical protein
MPEQELTGDSKYAGVPGSFILRRTERFYNKAATKVEEHRYFKYRDGIISCLVIATDVPDWIPKKQYHSCPGTSHQPQLPVSSLLKYRFPCDASGYPY